MDAEELTDAQRELLRAKIVRDLDEIAAGQTSREDAAKPVDLELSIGRLSRVDAMQSQALALARQERVALRAQQLRAALGRLDAGTYGACLRCEEPIGYPRLAARPEATLCVRCQR